MTLLDTTTAALALGVTDRTIRRLVHRGTLTNHGTNRAIKIAWEEIRRVTLRQPEAMSARV